MQIYLYTNVVVTRHWLTTTHKRKCKILSKSRGLGVNTRVVYMYSTAITAVQCFDFKAETKSLNLSYVLSCPKSHGEYSVFIRCFSSLTKRWINGLFERKSPKCNWFICKNLNFLVLLFSKCYFEEHTNIMSVSINDSDFSDIS